MTMSTNGVGATEAEFEAAHYSNPYASPELESEWETPETHEAHYANPFSAPELEEEWESHEAHFSSPEAEWEAPVSHESQFSSPELEEEWETPETHEVHYANPYSNPYSNPYVSPELEDEWESHETHYSNPYSSPELEEEWETHEAHFSNPEWEGEEEWETQFSSPEYEARPHARPRPAAHAPRPATHAPRPAGHMPRPTGAAHRPAVHIARPGLRATMHAPRPLPTVSRAAIPAVRAVIPHAQRSVVPVARHVLGRAAAPAVAGTVGMALPARSGRLQPWRWRAGYPIRRFPGRPRYGPGAVPPRPGVARPVSAGGTGVRPIYRAPQTGGIAYRAGAPPTFGRTRRLTVAGLLRQLADVLGAGEREAAELEASLFGANEFEGELSGHEAAHEAALTEVMAAEASHAESEGEAEALLGASLPITIRIMGARRLLRSVAPTLAQANVRLVRGVRRSSPSGRRLLRLIPTIQRRTVASLTAAARTGRPVTPNLVAHVTAAQAARVLGTPSVAGRALIRNTAIRRGTVAPPGRPVRAPRAMP